MFLLISALTNGGSVHSNWQVTAQILDCVFCYIFGIRVSIRKILQKTETKKHP